MGNTSACDINKVLITSFCKAKGLEKRLVVVFLDDRDNKIQNDDYVALTRASQKLIIVFKKENFPRYFNLDPSFNTIAEFVNPSRDYTQPIINTCNKCVL